MNLPKAPKRSFRRFQKVYRNQLWQVDLKYGPFLPDPDNPKRSRRTYLIAFIDDYTRLVPYAQFSLDQKLPVLEDCFRKAILKRGIPDNVYVDNGKIFVSKWFRMACTKLNIRHTTTAPFSPESKGRSSALWGRWTSSWRRCHWSTPRGSKNLTMPSRLGLKKATTTSPMPPQRKNTGQCFAGDSRKLRFVAPEELRDAFLWEETRKVDKTGCVKLNGWSLTWVQSLWVDLWTRDSTPST